MGMLTTFRNTLYNASLVELIDPLVPFFIASNALNILRLLSFGLKTTKIRKLVLPATLTFFIPPLLANLVFKQFIIDNRIIMSFKVALISFPLIVKNEKVL